MKLGLKWFQRRLLAWYDAHQRALPWRLGRDATKGARLDPFHVLVSEAMLQQTQVATVIPYFARFVQRFPTVQSLAEADEQEVLRHWAGLGYYSRARNLQNAARAIVEIHGGRVPSSVEELMALPGVGRYTAGAVASIAHEVRVPIVDGNVARVLCRIDKIESDPREPATRDRLWERAEEILPSERVGDFNSALMELGATVCVPRNPACLMCPVNKHCEALAAGVQYRIPPVRKAGPTPLERRWTFCIRRGKKWLIERRPMKGRWAGMWQFVTVEARNGKSGRGLDARRVLQCTGIEAGKARHLGSISHTLTHRRYEFEVFACELSGTCANGQRVWVDSEELKRYPMSRPQVKVAEMAISSAGADH